MTRVVHELELRPGGIKGEKECHTLHVYTSVESDPFTKSAKGWASRRPAKSKVATQVPPQSTQSAGSDHFGGREKVLVGSLDRTAFARRLDHRLRRGDSTEDVEDGGVCRDLQIEVDEAVDQDSRETQHAGECDRAAYIGGPFV